MFKHQPRKIGCLRLEVSLEVGSWILDVFQLPAQNLRSCFPNRAAIAHMLLAIPNENAVFKRWYMNCKGLVEQ